MRSPRWNEAAVSTNPPPTLRSARYSGVPGATPSTWHSIATRFRSLRPCLSSGIWFGGASIAPNYVNAPRIRMRLEDVEHGFRSATRTLLRARGMTAAAVGTLALGIGLSVAIFSVVQSVVLRQLPYADPDR